MCCDAGTAYEALEPLAGAAVSEGGAPLSAASHPERSLCVGDAGSTVQILASAIVDAPAAERSLRQTQVTHGRGLSLNVGSQAPSTSAGAPSVDQERLESFTIDCSEFVRAALRK
jgi:hypothetical protein